MAAILFRPHCVKKQSCMWRVPQEVTVGEIWAGARQSETDARGTPSAQEERAVVISIRETKSFRL